MEGWNKRNPQNDQCPIFRANMGGTMFFYVEDYVPYSKNNLIDRSMLAGTIHDFILFYNRKYISQRIS